MRPRSRKQVALILLKWGVLGGLGLAALAAVTVTIMFWVYGGDPDLPQIRTLKDYHPKQVTRILGSDGKVIGEIYDERRTYVPLDRISKNMQQAIIDAEDADFRTHQGLDYAGMLRAFWV